MIGILGGTFDPIHFGHLRPALDVYQALGLTQLRFIPLRDPPHRDTPNSSNADRKAMVQAAIAEQPGFVLDNQELLREGKSYSLHTLQALRQELGPDIPLCLLLGTDAFRGFPTWHKPNEIMQLAHLVVMQRPGEAPINYATERVTDQPESLQAQPAGKIFFLTVSQLEISSTAIRKQLNKGESPRYLLPESVLKIIQDRRLYRTD